MSRLVTVDTSALVKLFREETDSEELLALVRLHQAGAVRLIISGHVLTETIAVVLRRYGVKAARRTWDTLEDMHLTVVHLDRLSMDAVLRAAERFGCSLYDAFAPAVADLTGAELWSADARAHGAIPGVHLVG